MNDPRTAVIVGSGSGLSASLARLFAANGVKLALAARDTAKLKALSSETGAKALGCDATVPGDVMALFDQTDDLFGAPDIVVYNASARARGPIAELDPEAVKGALMGSAYGAFLVAQQAATRMLSARSGTILFTGASASVKGYPNSAPFAMGKFALRGLAQSLARELQPQNIHVAHFVIDGAIRNPDRTDPADNPDSMLDPDAIAKTYWQVANQDRSAWTFEVALRPWVEKF